MRANRYLLFALFISISSVASASFQMSHDEIFAKHLAELVQAPNAPLGYCMDGTQAAVEVFRAAGYNATYAMNVGTWDMRGHVWCLVESPHHTWLAWDNYYGVMTEEYYYNPEYAFQDFGEIEKHELRKEVKI